MSEERGTPEGAAPAADPRTFEADLAAMDNLRHAERLATLARLAAHIAHELGTPLNVIEAYALMMASGEVSGAAVQQKAQKIAEQAARMTKIIRDVLAFARRSSATPVTVELRELARTAVALSHAAARRHKVRLELEEGSSTVEVNGDFGKLLQVMMNLLLNGVQASEEGGTVRIAVFLRSHSSISDPDGPEMQLAAPDVALAAIEVRDQGCGLPKDSIAQIFKPFFTTRSAGEGVGLGLSVAEGIVKDHGGWIEVESEVGQGSCFTVYLPRGAR